MAPSTSCAAAIHFANGWAGVFDNLIDDRRPTVFVLMDFFYHHPPITAEVSVEFVNNDETNPMFFDRVSIGSEDLKGLSPGPLSNLAVNISPESKHPSFPPTGLTFWATPHGNKHGYSLRLPTPPLQDADQRSLLKIACRVSLTSLLPLKKVVLSALTRKGYDFASSNPTPFREWLFSTTPILRNGSVYRLLSPRLDSDIGDVFHEYFVIFSEPVAQGYALPSITEVAVSLCHNTRPNRKLEGDYEDEHIEIDQNFMANSILPKIDTIQTPKECMLTLVNGANEKSNPPNDHTVLLKPSDLSKLGLISGDWATIRPVKSQTRRLVKVAACQGVTPKRGEVSCCLALLRNLGVTPLGSDVHHISIAASPFGPLPPPLPTARSITVAQITSPPGLDELSGTSLLCGLQNYFKSALRLMKPGDVFIIPTDVDPLTIHIARTLRDAFHISDGDFVHPIGHYPKYSQFFLVTNIEYDVIHGQETVNSDPYGSASVGEFGCWVDCDRTRILQVGNEQSCVPGHWDPDCPTNTKGSDYQKLYQTFQVALMHSASSYDLAVSILLTGPRGVGKSRIVKSIANGLGIHLFEVDCYALLRENSSRTENSVRGVFSRAIECSPCVLLLRHLESLVPTTQQQNPAQEPRIAHVLQECLNGLIQPWKLTGYPLLVVGTTSTPQECSPLLLGCFKHEISIEPPDEFRRTRIWRECLDDVPLASDVDASRLAIHTAGLLASDFSSLVRRATSKSLERALSALRSPDPGSVCATSPNSDGVANSHILLNNEDLTSALDSARISYAEAIGAPKIPNVTWDDVGGLSSVKSDILDTIQLPLERPELFAGDLKKRSGVLLYGPPGTGKTLLAKAVATSCSLNFLSVKGPELLNMYIGESEANVRRVFQRARAARPCVIFFDELDSVAPKRGNQGDSGGVMDRIVSQLLSELDGMSSGAGHTDVFVIGATNRPDLLDPALLRPGRFDRMLYLGVPDSKEAQMSVICALTRKFHLHPGLSLHEIVAKCPFHFTGADFYALCSDAILIAMSRQAEQVDKIITLLNQVQSDHHPHPITPHYYLSEMTVEGDVRVLVTQHDFDLALSQLKPSVTEAEMEHYMHIKKSFTSDIPSGTHANTGGC